MAATEPQPLGQRLDALGVCSRLPEDALVSSAVVLLEVVSADGHSTLVMCYSPGTNWIKRLGMLTAAQSLENADYSPDNFSEDDEDL